MFAESLNTSHVSVQVDKTARRIFSLKFKYITCVGSSYLWHVAPLCHESLNTSHVSVQAASMLLRAAKSSFKYITCVGSRLGAMLMVE